MTKKIMQAKVAQWINESTPEQKQKVTDAFQQTVALAESFGSAVDSITPQIGAALAKAAPLFDAYIQYGQAAAAVMDSLNAMKRNPDIMASPFIAAFVERLCDEVGQSCDPFDVLASRQKEIEQPRKRAKAIKAVSSRKDRSVVPELKEFAVKVYRQGPFGGGEWHNLPTAARYVERKVNARASELGWNRKTTRYSYQVIQRWIEEGLEPTE